MRKMFVLRNNGYYLRGDLFLFFNSYSLSVYVDYVNYFLVIFMSHLHLNEPSLICDNMGK